MTPPISDSHRPLQIFRRNDTFPARGRFERLVLLFRTAFWTPGWGRPPERTPRSPGPNRYHAIAIHGYLPETLGEKGTEGTF
jgi:hypothetical protein